MASSPRRYNMLLLVHVVRHRFLNDVDGAGITMRELAAAMNQTAQLLQIGGKSVTNETVSLLLQKLADIQAQLLENGEDWQSYYKQTKFPPDPDTTRDFDTPRAMLADLLGFTFTIDEAKNGLPQTVHFSANGTLQPGGAAALARLAADYPFLQDDQAAALIRDLTMACGTADTSFLTQGRGKHNIAHGVNLFENLYQLERIMELFWTNDPLHGGSGREQARPFLNGDADFRNDEIERAVELDCTPDKHLFLLTSFTYCRWTAAKNDGTVQLQPAKGRKKLFVVPCRLVFSNGYYYLVCFRLDKNEFQDHKPVLSNLRLDRMQDISPEWKLFSRKNFDSLCSIKNYFSELRHSRDDIDHRNFTTVMYSGAPVNNLRLYLRAGLLNNAVDDFGAANLTAVPLPRRKLSGDYDWLEVTVKQCVWGGAKQFIMQHADGCCLAKDEPRTEQQKKLQQDLTDTMVAALELQNDEMGIS